MKSRVTALRLGLVLTWLAFVATVLWRPQPGEFNAWFDVGVYNLPFALAGVACWVGGSRAHRARAGWRTLGAGFALFVIGNFYGSLIVGDQDIYPSPADGMWLSFYVLVYVAIVKLVRARVSGFQPSTWLDGAVGGLGAASLAVAFALAPVLAETQGRLPVVATNLAYPTAEIILIIFLVAAGRAVGGGDRSWWLLATGLAVFCATDITYLFLESRGAYAEGGLLDVGWPLAAVAIGYGACLTERASPPARARQSFLFPMLVTVTSVGLLVYGQARPLPWAAVGLAAAALAAAATRVALTVREVTSLAESRREARTDDLTGLANRRRLFEHLAVEFATPGATNSLLILDLDRFKEVNDSLGHSAGDELLHAIGRRLLGVLPQPALFARLGGDEFAVVLGGRSLEDAVRTAHALREALREPFALSGMLVSVDASVGVACSPDHAPDAERMMSCADIAMFRAKRNRTGVEAFQPDRDDPSRDRLAMLGELTTALAEKQLLLHYQPQLNLRTGRVSGIEALIRWQHPVRGLIPPDQFLPLAEQSNLMTAVTAFVLNQALSDCSRLRSAGFALRVSVNVSPADLIDATLPDTIDQHLARHGLPPGLLAIEVTEDIVMADRVRALQVLHRLRAAGIEISVDDFGTGQSSLSYLRDLPISEIKLDRSFLRGIPRDAHNAAIVRSTIELAHALDLPIVTEGVEDSAALEWLGEAGCDLGQGFHIARPLPLPELLLWLRSSNTTAPAPSPRMGPDPAAGITDTGVRAVRTVDPAEA